MVQIFEQEKKVYFFVKMWVEEVKKFVVIIDGGFQEWIYFNYVDKSQNFFKSYGFENICKLKVIVVKYDFQGVFQKLVFGGFKVFNF